MSESDLYPLIMIRATQLGHRMWRNQIGIAKYRKAGRDFVIPYGIPGTGGSDLIGLTVVDVGDMVTLKRAIFTAIEVKGKDTPVTDDQWEFCEAILNVDGFAGVVKSIQGYEDCISSPPFVQREYVRDRKVWP